MTNNKEELVNKINELEKLTRFLLESQEVGKVGSWERNVEKGTLTGTPELFKIIGMNPSEDMSIRFSDYLTIVHPEDMPKISEGLRVAFESKTTYNVEYRILRPDGKSVTVWVRGNVMEGEHGKPVLFRGTLMDITERKKVEEDLKKSETFLNSIIENIPNMVFLKDAKELRFVRFNKAGEELLGYRMEELLGKNDYDFFPPTEADQFTEKDRNVLNSGKLLLIPEEPIHTKFKGERILETKKIPLNDEHGNPAFLLGISNDITDEIKIRAEIKKINEGLEQIVLERTKALKTRNTQLVDFCNIVSHNLRAPLVNLTMLVDFLIESKDNQEREELLSKVKPVIAHLHEMFNELVESIQISQDTEIKWERILLQNCLDNVLIGFESEIKSYGAEIKIDFESNTTLYCPTKYLESILANLISNALKYRSPDRKPLIVISCQKNGSEIVLSVADNGLGIDLKMHQHKMFKIRGIFHVHPDSKGFGLFMTKTQVDAMGGRIWVESSPDIGSIFFVAFINQKG